MYFIIRYIKILCFAYNKNIMEKFKPVKQEKTVISIRLDVDTLKNIDEISQETDISRNELIVQCINFALKNFKK